MTRETPKDDGSADSRRRINEARRQAADAGKRVAVVFGADWCPDHQALEQALESQYVVPFVDGVFEVVVVDVGQRDRSLELMGEYGMRVERGIPAVVILEPDGTVVTAQKDGEFATARSLPVVEIAKFFKEHGFKEHGSHRHGNPSA
ncbi:MAG: thioredoxin family protein [Acidobacteriota bacterium]